MSILAGKDTRVVVQGMTGVQGLFHAQRMQEYGTRIVSAVTPGRGGERCLGVPVFNSVRDAVEATGATASVIFVPASTAADAIIEAAEAGINLIVCITRGIPVHDLLRVKAALTFYNARLVGPNTPGIITPGECNLGIMPPEIYSPGTIGIISRSSTLTYEAVRQTTELGLGQSTCVGIGGDPIHGMNFMQALELFESDRKTKGMIMLGMIGTNEEEETAEFIRQRVRKPVVAYIAGTTASAGARMGHAGALVARGLGTAKSKINALESGGALVVRSPLDMGQRMWEFFKG
ncbi:MAG: succinate--CoA ligase subunit alpha [Gammaproteobacteria bacterium]|nr:succinate--CoA ligase subunit alpha [Gammaproteobacteria bacterium]